jgi:DnaK suppressor protein
MEHPALRNSDLNKIRAILEARVADLERGVTQRDDIAVESTPDAVDEVQRASERALAISNIERESKQLQNAGAALRRIHDGIYGICEECEEQISPKRLSAIPWAPLCLLCQEARDRKDDALASDVVDQRYAA